VLFTRSELRSIGLTLAVVVAAAVTYYAKAGGSIAPFVISGAALALLASLVGRSVEALGGRLGAGATGVVQSALGNLPELFVVLFALKSKLYEVATATIVGSVLANVLLVLGLAFVIGGARNGVQHFEPSGARRVSLMLLLSVAALVIPALTALLHTPAAGHERALSIAVSILLLILFIASLPDSVRKTEADGTETSHNQGHEGEPGWPLWLALAMLAAAGVAAAFVSDWFVAGLTPAISSLHISETFAGLVIVAIAGNAVENVVGVQLAYRNQPDHALQVILQSPVQIVMMVAPALVLLSPVVGASFTLVLPPLLLAVLLVAVVVAMVAVQDGDSTWLEGGAMITLYAMMATAFWWG
jgi:Ca2+:H+ antiporter